MKLKELALYKLAEKEKITLEQARIILAISNKKTSEPQIAKETGLDWLTLTMELNNLIERKIIHTQNNFFYLQDFEETISELIKGEKNELLLVQTKN